MPFNASKYFPQIVKKFFKTGLLESIREILYMKHVMGGRQVGVDKFGNKYYEVDSDVALHCIYFLYITYPFV